jgi:N-acetylglutamate synthase-like GNAT family acetyltransferase
MQMITIDLLANHPDAIPDLAEIWYETLGKTWIPGATVEKAIKEYHEHLNEEDLPMTLVALKGGKAVGMCSLRENDGIREDLMPWLGSLVVHPDYQNQGIGKELIDATIDKVAEMGATQLYLFALDPTIPEYYSKLGWKTIDTDVFKGHPVTVMEMSIS